ncbi:hypothetical protein GWK47_010366 [Chionoecetes opilio]|uniref:FAM21/CAPZIP domain-containing protein n=1 Tax=Chionoecetes opilio TaxID=41210 RepID=A0A8J4XYM4_CHIOP|nr:hypothetical protein GWK47_010366 [Chionoecetes opilio]
MNVMRYKTQTLMMMTVPEVLSIPREVLAAELNPVPVYALIDPYEHKPLPLIIGSEGFLSDDKVGLEVSSSEENSRMTFSPEDTESEGELEDETDRVALQQKAIPASSSMAVDEESDSEWSAEDDPLPDKSSTVVGKQRPLQLSSDEENDMFGPPARNSEKVGNIFSQKNTAGTTTPTTHVNSRRTAAPDSDSEEDEGLFGKQQRSSGLFEGRRQPSTSHGSAKTPDSLIPSAGVENVRAMPDATPVTAPDPHKSRKKENNLFASDSEDEGDLFSSKPAASGKSTNEIQHSQGEPQVSSSGGLFSSDDDSPLFSGPTPTQGPKNSREDHEEPPPLPKAPARKVPAGGVSIFGAAITSALRRQQSSDEESSDDGHDEDLRTKDPVPVPPPAKPVERAPQKPAQVKMPVKGGLFDSDEDENLFDTLVRKPAVVTNDVEKTHSNTVPSPSVNITKAEEKISHIDKESASKLDGKDTVIDSTAGLFSDEEDDIFGIPTAVKNKDVSLPRGEPLLRSPEVNQKKPAETIPEAATREAVKASRPPPLFTPPDNPTPSQPITISDPPKSNISLFSSPSDDDDDDIFSSISNSSHKASHASAFMTDPPPLPPRSNTNHAEPASKGVTQSGAQNDADIKRSINVDREGNAKESVSSSLFSATSDEDIFSSISLPKNSSQIPTPEASKVKTEVSQSVEEPKLDTKTAAVISSQDTSHSEMEESKEIFLSPPDNTFKPISQTPDTEPKQGEIFDQRDNFSEELSKSVTQNHTSIGTDGKDDNIFDSTEDLFGVPERLDKPNGSPKKENSHGPLKPAEQSEANAGTSSMVSGDAVDPLASRLLKEDSDSLNEKTSPPSPLPSQSTPSGMATQESKGVTKPPVGGVALFGGKELAAQISKRKTLLEPGEDKQEIKNNIFDDVQDSVLEGKTSVFDDSDDDIFGNNTGNSKSTTGRMFSRQSPPLLPEEAEKKMVSKKQEPDKVQIPESKPMDSEPRKSNDIEVDQQKLKSDKSEDESREEMTNKEIKPRKKPPIGGVSMFGSGGIGGSELFAKVLQRKSMLAPESDSSEEDTPTEPAGTQKSITSTEKSIADSKPVIPVSPVSPITFPPVFAPDPHESKSGGDENSVSFDDPATHSNVLQSLNKTRARGSIKRRPPSKLLKKGSVDRSEPSNTQDTSSTTETPSPASTMEGSVEHPHATTTDVSKTVSHQPDDRLLHAPAGKEQTKVPADVKENKVEDASVNRQTVTSSKESNSIESTEDPVGVSPEKKKVTSVDKKDALNATKSAQSVSKTSSKQNSSLFGGSDSDEDLFGEGKQKQDTWKSSMSSGATSASKMASKTSKSHSLFEDDDDGDDNDENQST